MTYRHASLEESHIKKIRALRRQGLTYPDIALRVGCGASTAAKYGKGANPAKDLTHPGQIKSQGRKKAQPADTSLSSIAGSGWGFV